MRAKVRILETARGIVRIRPAVTDLKLMAQNRKIPPRAKIRFQI
jgi:hypothetical protein